MSSFWTVYALILLREFCALGAMIWQQPRFLRVAAGTRVTLTCNITALPVQCSLVHWLHVRRTDGLSLYSNAHSKVTRGPGDYEMIDKACLLHIPKARLSDTGTFYCAIDNTGMIELGNGSTLTVSESEIPRTAIEIFVPGPQALNLSTLVTLMCLVSGVNLSPASVFWEVDRSTVTPGQPEFCVHGPVQARDTLETWLTIPSQTWASGSTVTCVLETNTGQRWNRTVKRTKESESSSLCVIFTVGGLCITTFIVISFAVIISTFITIPSQDIPACKRTPADPSKIQYATLRYEGRRREMVSFI